MEFELVDQSYYGEFKWDIDWYLIYFNSTQQINEILDYIRNPFASDLLPKIIRW